MLRSARVGGEGIISPESGTEVDGSVSRAAGRVGEICKSSVVTGLGLRV